MNCDIIDIDFFIQMLKIDSTSSHERAFSDFLSQRLTGLGGEILQFPKQASPDEPVNLLLKWGDPIVTYCTHLDTVPPYLPPTLDGQIIQGRGACDAKGQIYSMLRACQQLAQEGESGFALLLLYGEETGSFGAKQYRELPGGEYIVVGEPTDNRMATASKGTKSFGVNIKGKAAHSGYPQQGESAVDIFVDFVNKLRQLNFPIDPVLGKTTYNIGQLKSDNPQNILSAEVTCRVYFRTTFASDAEVSKAMQEMASEKIEITPYGGDTPSKYFTIPGIDTTTVAFGSDAPQLTNFKHKALVGPGSILVAHTDAEYISKEELNKATEIYIKIFKSLKNQLS